MNLKDRFFRYNVYFRQGHTFYLAYMLAMCNFMVIQYRLLIESVPFLQMVFPSMLVFAGFSIVCYFPLATLIGWLDYKRGSIPTQSTVMMQNSPYAKDQMRGLWLISKGRGDEAAEIFERWMGKHEE